MATRDINQEWMEWCKQHEGFPEDFIAEAMADEEPDEKDLKRRAKEIKTEITLDQFRTAVAKSVALFKSVSEFAGVEFNMDPYVRVAALVATELFDEEEEA